MNKYRYAREKFYYAMQALATGEGDVRSRLLMAFQASLFSLEAEHFPPELQSDWKWIIDQLTKSGPVDDREGALFRGSIENTMQNIKNSTGTKIAGKIFEIGWKLHTDEN